MNSRDPTKYQTMSFPLLDSFSVFLFPKNGREDDKHAILDLGCSYLRRGGSSACKQVVPSAYTNEHRDVRGTTQIRKCRLPTDFRRRWSKAGEASDTRSQGSVYDKGDGAS